MVIVIQDAAFSSRSLLEIYISIGECPIAPDSSVVFLLSADLNDIRSLLYHNHIQMYIKYIS